MSRGKIRAWTTKAFDTLEGVRAAYVGVPPGEGVPLTRAPAEKLFASIAEARSWIEEEARALGVSVEWGAEGPHRSFV